MPMLYVPKNPRLTEKIAVYGQNGVGKTHVAISMMRRMTDRRFHIMDTNAAYDFAIYEDDVKNAKIIAAENFTVYTPDNTEWEDQKAAIQSVVDGVQPGDWAVFDMLDDCWESVPGWYTRKYLGLDETEYRAMVRLALEEKRQEQLKGGGKGDRTSPLFDQLRDYQHINPEYRKAVYRGMRNVNAKGAHVLAIVSSKPVTDNDPKDIRDLYRAVGSRPASQKELTREVNTIIHLKYDSRADSYEMTTVKDRGSRKTKKLDEEVWSDFCATYLGPVAGWKMEKVG